MSEWVIEQPGAQDPANRRTRSSARRTHKKSRNGCQECKKRRIKCDELQPACRQCQDRRIDCHYGKLTGGSVKAENSPQSSEVSERHTERSGSSVVERLDDDDDDDDGEGEEDEDDSPRAKILRYLEKTDVTNGALGHRSLYRPEQVSDILDHFQEDTSRWLGSPTCQVMMQANGVRLAVDAPYLLHAIFAISAGHLNYLYPAEKGYEIAAVLHYTLSLRTFAKQLQIHVAKDNADAIFGCCFLQAMLAFMNKQELSEQDASRSPLTRRFAWLRSIQPVPIIARSHNLFPAFKTSVWAPVFMEGGAHKSENGSPAYDSPSSTGSVIDALQDLYNCSPSPTGDASPYADTLERITSLLRTPINTTQIGSLMRVVGNLPPAFHDLLDRGDPRALLLMCYWCAFMSQVDQWWTQRPGKLECYSICETLAKSGDGRIVELLRFPAAQCGFHLPEYTGHFSPP